MKPEIGQAIDSRYADVRMTPEMEDRFLENVYKSDRRTPRKRPRRAVMAVAAALLVLLCVPVLGATVPAVNNALARWSPELAALLMPVSITVEAEGIEVTVVSAIADDYTLLLVIEMRDLEGDRISGDTYPGVQSTSHLTGTSASYGYYDEEAGTLYCAVTTTQREPYDGVEEMDFVLHFDIEGIELRLDGPWTFSVTPEKVESTRLEGTFTTYIYEEREFSNMVLSPISLRFEGEKPLYSSWLDMEVVLTDGTIYQIGRHYYGEDGYVNCGFTYSWDKDAGEYVGLFTFDSAINLDEIESLTICGTQII